VGDDDGVGVGGMLELVFRLDRSKGTVKDGRAVAAQTPADLGELVAAADCESGAHVSVIVGRSMSAWSTPTDRDVWRDHFEADTRWSARPLLLALDCGHLAPVAPMSDDAFARVGGASDFVVMLGVRV
jgi:hypothetical protein